VGLHRLALTHSEPLFVRCGALMACRAEISDTVGFIPHQRKGNRDVVCVGAAYMENFQHHSLNLGLILQAFGIMVSGK
jgi:hypothetical protein